jgi:hypothetical protein
MPPRRKRAALDDDVAKWVAVWNEEHGKEGPIEWPSWKYLPDILNEVGVNLNGDPSIKGWRIHPDGHIEVVRRGS